MSHFLRDTDSSDSESQTESGSMEKETNHVRNEIANLEHNGKDESEDDSDATSSSSMSAKNSPAQPISQQISDKRARDGADASSLPSNKKSKHSKSENKAEQQRFEFLSPKVISPEKRKSAPTPKVEKAAKQKQADGKEKSRTVDSVMGDGQHGEKSKSKTKKKQKDPSPEIEVGGSQVEKVELDNSPLKSAKRPIQNWSTDDEITLSSHILKYPITKGGNYWADQQEILKSKLAGDWSKEQMYEKYRRMKLRYESIVKMKAEGKYKPKNSGEEQLFAIWQQLYGGSSEAADTNGVQEPERVDEQANIVKVQKKEKAARKKGKDSSDKNGHVAGATDGNLVSKLVASPFKSTAERSIVPSEDLPPTRKESVPLVDKVKTGANLDQHKQIVPLVDKVNTGGNSHNPDQHTNDVNLQQMHNKFEDMLNGMQTKIVTFVEDAVRNVDGKFDWLAEWMMMSSMTHTMTPISPFWGGVGGDRNLLTGLGISGSTSSNDPTLLTLKEGWLELQSQEFKLFEHKMQLLQQVCQRKKEQLKKQ